MSELVRGHGLRRSRYRGFAKVELQNLLIATALPVESGSIYPGSSAESK
jgi:hypothetical protein